MLLTFINMSLLARVMRGSMIETLSSNYIRTRARRPAEPTIVLRHALKPALMPVVSLFGTVCITSITAAVVTESVFALPPAARRERCHQPRLHWCSASSC